MQSRSYHGDYLHRQGDTPDPLQLVEGIPWPQILGSVCYFQLPRLSLPGYSCVLLVNGKGRDPWPGPRLGRMLVPPGPAAQVVLPEQPKGGITTHRSGWGRTHAGVSWDNDIYLIFGHKCMGTTLSK